MGKCNLMPLLAVGLPLTLRFCFENLFIKCSLILSSETLTLLYFASRIRSQCCMLHVLKREVLIRGGGRWGTRPPFYQFSGSASGYPTWRHLINCERGDAKCLIFFTFYNVVQFAEFSSSICVNIVQYGVL